MPKVMVIGDAILDKMTLLKSTGKTSSEAPVPLFEPDGPTQYRLGGAAATAAMCAKLGADTQLVCAGTKEDNFEPGSEQDHEHLLSLHNLAGYGLAGAPYIDSKKDVLTVKHRFLVKVSTGYQQVLRIDRDRQAHPDLSSVERVMRLIFEEDPHVVIASDYGKGMLTSGEMIERIIDQCNHMGISVLVDPHHTTPFHRYKDATIFVPNLIESRGQHPKEIREDYKFKGCILKRGCDGCEVDFSDRYFSLPARKPMHLVDTLGAGDQFIATLAVAGVNLDFDWGCAAVNAIVASSLQCESLGVTPVSPEAIRDEYSEYCSTLGTVSCSIGV